MKPLLLTMSAFGSYAGKQTVNFEKIDHGLILITGDTGAGKTTIFDAVIFALYGESSGGSRKGTMMRSHYASDDAETYVELKFRVRDIDYVICRSPNYSRTSKRKNKNGEFSSVSVQERVSLIMPDGKEVPGNVKEINQRVQEIIGIDRNQFSQIAMIAQGEYLKLLHAPSKERKEIFSKIFPTGIYFRIQQLLKENNRTLYEKLEDNKKLYEHELNQIAFSEENIRKEEWEALLPFSETKSNELLELLEFMIEETQETEQYLKKQEYENYRQQLELQKLLKQAEDNNKLFDKQEAVKKELLQLLSQKEDQNEKTSRLQSAKRAMQMVPVENRYLEKKAEHEQTVVRIKELEEKCRQYLCKHEQAEKEWKIIEGKLKEKVPELTTALTRLFDMMPAYEELEEKQIKLQAEYKKELFTQEEAEKIKERLKNIEQKMNVLFTEQEKLAESSLKKQENEQKISRLKEQKIIFAELSEIAEKLPGLRQELAFKQEELKNTHIRYRASCSEFDEKNKSFISAQAGILAEDLEEGVPCPVCGSKTHPEKAVLEVSDITELQVEHAKQKRDKLEQELSRKTEEAGKAAEICKTQESLLQKLGKQEWGLSFQIEKTDELLKESIAKCGQEMEAADMQLKKACKEVLKFEKNKAELEQGREEKERLLIEYQHDLEEFQILQIENQGLRKEIEHISKKLYYPAKEAAQKAYKQYASEKKRIESEAEKAKQTVEELSRILSEQNSELRFEQEKERKAAAVSQQLYQEFEQELLKQGFAEKERYQSAKRSLSEIEAWEVQIKNYEQALLKLQTINEEYLKQTENKEKADTEIWKQKIIAADASRKALQDKITGVSGILVKNIKSKEVIQILLKERESLLGEYQLMNHLCTTANGEIKGSVRLDFQTYVQRQYFKQMIFRANKRLSYMTDGQFLLQCRELETLGKQGEAGLDLDVYSVATGKTRDVKTLSGGESFMAALSMALGMADVIQNTAGKIQLDMMFIDEGFGSLDEVSRNRSIQILQELAGEKRLIGIISHVTELKEQIERKLIVKKTEKGSTIRMEMEG